MPITRSIIASILLVCLAGSPAVVMTGCEDLPGSREQQATVIGGASGAVLGAVLASENRLLGALIGGLLGAGGGYLIGANTDWFDDDDEDVEREVRRSVEEAQENPATAAEARRANTADINGDGFVTMDEIVAMERAGFTDEQMIRRLERADQVYDLSSDQRQVLLDAGVSRRVVDELPNINRAERERILSADRGDVIGRERDFDADDGL